MFRSLFKREPSDLDKAIADVYACMHMTETESDEFTKLLSNLERLEKLKNKQSSRVPSPDTIAVVVGNLAGVLIIVVYEQKHIFASKAQAFIMKVKT